MADSGSEGTPESPEWRGNGRLPSSTSGESFNSLGKQSSIGDVATLRSRLQARRVTLNEEIGKENRMKTGSKRLLGATVDHKTRDQAALEVDFAESKIRVLQSELAKINSSLQAYQADEALDSQVPLIPLALKTTSKVNFVSPFSAIIRKHYHCDPAAFEECIHKFQALRESATDVSRDEEGVLRIHKYHNQLQLVSKRFLHSGMRHAIAFTWYDTINGLVAIQQSVIFEMAATVFNLSALYTQLAAKENRSTPEGIETAIVYLEKAIGCFEYTKRKFSHSPTKDMSDEMLSFFGDLMKAQVQELQWEKDVLAGLKGDILSLIGQAHKTKSVAECYRPVRELIDEEAVKAYLPDCWISIIKIKEAHYKALAHYYAAVTHEHVAAIYSDGGHISEDVRTELLFLYSDAPQEVVSNDPKLHIGLMKSHLNCAALSHEYALKYNSLCKDLLPITPLYDMLEEASEASRVKREAAERLMGDSIMAPVIQACEVTWSPVPPDFSSVKVQDIFRALGPLPMFSAEYTWSPPRVVTLKKREGGFGFSIKGSRPVTVTGVDQGGQAEVAGIKVGDWLLGANGTNLKHVPHSVAVQSITEAGENVAFEMTTPAATNN